MRLSLRILSQIALNTLAFYLAISVVPRFHISPPLTIRFTLVVLLFTILNMFLRPLFKIIFGPLILFTFGLFLFVINALILLILDSISNSVTIQGLFALLAGAVLVGGSNLGTSIIARTLRIRR